MFVNNKPKNHSYKLGQLMLMEPLINTRPNSRQPDKRDADVISLTIRAYDLGVPVMDSTTTVRIYPPESKTQSITFVLPGRSSSKKDTQQILSAVFPGGEVIINDIRDEIDGNNVVRCVNLYFHSFYS